MADPEIRMIYITASNADEALRIGRALVEERLAACANIIGPIRSLYWWEGKLQEEPEAICLCKTRAALVARLTQRVKELHGYECPCVVAVPIDGGNPAFLEWVERETGERY